MNLVDSCGWLEYVANSLNASFYAKAIEDTDRLVVPTVCVYEVFRRLLQQVGRSCALEVVASMCRGQVIPLNDTLAIQAAALGIEMRLPLADSIVLATAREYGAVLWTQDTHFANIPGVKYRSK